MPGDYTYEQLRSHIAKYLIMMGWSRAAARTAAEDMVNSAIATIPGMP